MNNRDWRSGNRDRGLLFEGAMFAITLRVSINIPSPSLRLFCVLAYLEVLMAEIAPVWKHSVLKMPVYSNIINLTILLEEFLL